MRSSLNHLTDQALLAQVKHLVQREREATAALVAHLAEVKRRGLYLAEGASSMFKYCTQVLHLSEHAAYLRLEAASTAQRFPAILDALESGALSLSAIKLLAPALTVENCGELIEAARHRSKSEIEALLARRRPRPDVPNLVRKLPTKRGGEVQVVISAPGTVGTDAALDTATLWKPAETAAPTTVTPVTTAATATGEEVLATAGAAMAPEARVVRAVISPLAPERYKVQFTASVVAHASLRRAQDLLRHRIPDGDVSKVFELALAALVEKLEKEKLAATTRPRPSGGVGPGSRRIPAAVKRAVWKRDGGRCVFIGKGGRPCAETGCLEFHHLVPFGRDGEATMENIQLRCRAHNQYEAFLDFGPRGRPRGSASTHNSVRT